MLKITLSHFAMTTYREKSEDREEALASVLAVILVETATFLVRYK